MWRQGWNFRARQAFESMMVRSVGVESKLLPERESVVMFFAIGNARTCKSQTNVSVITSDRDDRHLLLLVFACLK
jgi:hypothetical protein